MYRQTLLWVKQQLCERFVLNLQFEHLLLRQAVMDLVVNVAWLLLGPFPALSRQLRWMVVIVGGCIVVVVILPKNQCVGSGCHTAKLVDVVGNQFSHAQMEAMFLDVAVYIHCRAECASCQFENPKRMQSIQDKDTE